MGRTLTALLNVATYLQFFWKVAMKTMTSRQANQDFSRAKREAKAGPVIITERGRPANVLMSYAEYQRLTGCPKNLFDLLAMPGQEHVEFEPPPRSKARPRDIDFG